MNPTASKYTVLNQIFNQIPRNLIAKLARKHGVDKRARGFTPLSHIVSMVFAQLAHSLSLNDVADALRNHVGSVATIRGASPPSRNGLSHASKVRNADMAEDLFWSVLDYIQNLHPMFGYGHKYSGLPRRFKRAIYGDRLNYDSTGRQLRRLGKTSPPKGCRKVPHAIESSDLPAAIRNRQSRQHPRFNRGKGTLRKFEGWRNSLV